MRITVERSGGVAGLMRAISLDRKDLPSALATEFDELMSAVDWQPVKSKPSPAARGADRFQYRVVVDSDRGSHEISVGEAAMTDRLRACVRFVEKHGSRIQS